MNQAVIGMLRRACLICGFFRVNHILRNREFKENLDGHTAPLGPGTATAGTWHAFGLRKDKIKRTALKDKRNNNKVGKMLHRRESGRERDRPCAKLNRPVGEYIEGS